MQRFRSWLSYGMFAVLACFGFSGVALASDYQPSASHLLRAAIADLGYHGAESAKFTAEQAYMASLDERMCSSTAGLISESNGFRLADLMKSGVAGGKSCVGFGESVVS